MRAEEHIQRVSNARGVCVALLLVCLASAGCAAIHRVPATEIANSPHRSVTVPIDFTLLGQSTPAEHIIGPGDVLGIFIEDVLGMRGDLPPVAYPSADLRDPVALPAVGHPMEVRTDGHVKVHALIPPVKVTGATLDEASERLRRACVDAKLLVPERAMVTVNLIKPRTFQVTVMREDSPADNVQTIGREAHIITKRGSGHLLELPVYENDVLHALTLSGGLPGHDSPSELWVLRRSGLNDHQWREAQHCLSTEGGPESILSQPHLQSHVTRIPLRLTHDEPLPCSPGDVLLYDGDVVFIGGRECDYFVAGGLLPGNKIYLPRDHDTDVLTAIGMANGNVIGAPQSRNNFARGVGNVLPPMRVDIVRRLSFDEQILIEVNLRRALVDPRERVIIQPGDIVLLRYRPYELLANLGLNLISFNFVTAFN